MIKFILLTNTRISAILEMSAISAFLIFGLLNIKNLQILFFFGTESPISRQDQLESPEALPDGKHYAPQ